MPTRGDKKVKSHIIKPRWGLPGGHLPTKHPPLDEILLNDAIEYLGDKVLADKASVEKQIGFIVALHRELKNLEKKPIRPSNIKSNLNCVMESAKELRSRIAVLDYFSLRALRQHGVFEHPSLIAPIADSQRSGDEFEAICDKRESRLLTLLNTIVEASEQASAELPELDSGRPIKQPMLGDWANYELVAACFGLFDERRPGEAKTTQGGDFRTFVSIVHQLSTGVHKDLERQVKRHNQKVKANRKYG